MRKGTAGIIVAGLIAAAGYLVYWAGRNAEFDHMANRARNAGEIYTFLSNGDRVRVIYEQAE